MQFLENDSLERIHAMITEFQKRQNRILTLAESKIAQQDLGVRAHLAEIFKRKAERKIGTNPDPSDGNWGQILVNLMDFYRKTSVYRDFVLNGLNIPISSRAKNFAINTAVAYCAMAKAERKAFVQNIIEGRIKCRLSKICKSDPRFAGETFLSLWKSILNFQDRMIEPKSQMNIWKNFQNLPENEATFLRRAINNSLARMEVDGKNNAVRYLSRKLAVFSTPETTGLALRGINPFWNEKHLQYCSAETQIFLQNNMPQIIQELFVFAFLFLSSAPQKRMALQKSLAQKPMSGSDLIRTSQTHSDRVYS